MRPLSHCELVTWETFYSLARKLALEIKAAGVQPDVIVAISRGGCIPARVICDYLDVFDLDVIKIEHYHGTHKEKLARLRYPMSAEINDKCVLLVDDVSDTGDSFEVGIDHLLQNGKPAELKTASLHHKTASSYMPDFCAEIVHQWRWIIYPWAVMEDLRSLGQDMIQSAMTAADLGRHFTEQYQIQVPEPVLNDLLLLSD